MSEWLLPAAVLLIALGSTYLFCLRSTRNGDSAAQPTTSGHEGNDLDRALQQARQELQRSGEEFGLEAARPQSGRRRPGASPTAAGAPSGVSFGDRPHA